MRKGLLLGYTVATIFLLAACGNKATANSTSSSHQSITSSAKRTSHMKTSTKPAAQSSSKPAVANESFFPANMQHTWYTFDTYTNKVKTVSFTANQMTADNTTSTMHTSQDRTSADNAILSGNAQPTTPEQKDHADNWALFSTCNIRGASWVNIMGWYQSAGDGSFFTVLNETVNGKQVPVLFSASGAEAWTDAHYYLSADLATAQKNTKYAEDHSRDDDDDSNSDSQSNDDDSSDQTDDNDSDSQQDDSDTQSDNDNNSVDTNDDNDDDDY